MEVVSRRQKVEDLDCHAKALNFVLWTLGIHKIILAVGM